MINGLQKIRTLDFLTTDRTLGQAALSWLLAEPAVVTALPNIYDRAQLDEFAAASDLPPLTAPQNAAHRRARRRELWRGRARDGL